MYCQNRCLRIMMFVHSYLLSCVEYVLTNSIENYVENTKMPKMEMAKNAFFKSRVVGILSQNNRYMIKFTKINSTVKIIPQLK